jgi:hypothetical protein
VAATHAHAKLQELFHDSPADLSRLKHKKIRHASRWKTVNPESDRPGLALTDLQMAMAVRFDLGLFPTPDGLPASACSACHKLRPGPDHALVCRQSCARALMGRHNDGVHLIRRFASLALIATQAEPSFREIRSLVQTSPDYAAVLLNRRSVAERDDSDDRPDQRRYDLFCKMPDAQGLDFTVVHGTSSMADLEPAQVIKARFDAKLKTYEGKVWPLVLTSYGGLHPRFYEFVIKMAHRYEDIQPRPNSMTRRQFVKDFLDELAVTLQRSQAVALLQHNAHLVF